MIPNYRHLFVGYSNDIYYRLHGSSGGVGTTLLHYLLETREVDGVIAVGFDEKNKTQAVYKFIDDPSQITQLSGSKYVYMSLAPLLKLLQRYSLKKLAVVVEPCFVKAVRKMAPHCKYVISFFCGYNMEYEGTRYLLKKSRIPERDITAIGYRDGKYPGGFTVYARNGSLRNFGKPSYELVNLMFLREGCHKCRLYIAPDADIVLGDAWLKGVKNESVVLAHTSAGDTLLKEMHQKNLLTLYDLNREELLRMHRHNLKYKTYGHSPAMLAVVKLFNNHFARRFAPFYFFSFLSRIRRFFMYGINMRLHPTRHYKT